MVGDTGAGKSSLMNALIDQLDVLPTSGMRACTAVVVEVVENTVNKNFEADITFLTKQVGLIISWIIGGKDVCALTLSLCSV